MGGGAIDMEFRVTLGFVIRPESFGRCRSSSAVLATVLWKIESYLYVPAAVVLHHTSHITSLPFPKDPAGPGSFFLWNFRSAKTRF